MFCRTVFMHWKYCVRVLPSVAVLLQLEKSSIIFIMTFAYFSLKTKITQSVKINNFTFIYFKNTIENFIINLFPNIPLSSAY